MLPHGGDSTDMTDTDTDTDSFCHLGMVICTHYLAQGDYSKLTQQGHFLQTFTSTSFRKCHFKDRPCLNKSFVDCTAVVRKDCIMHVTKKKKKCFSSMPCIVSVSNSTKANSYRTLWHCWLALLENEHDLKVLYWCFLKVLRVSYLCYIWYSYIILHWLVKGQLTDLE